MCVSLCHRRKLLYFNHDDCSAAQCPHTDPPGRCADCCHRRGEVCGLTRAKLPAAGGGCCHYNVVLYDNDALPVVPETLVLLGMRPGESIEMTLDAYDVYFEMTENGVIVPVDDLATPDIYGRGTEPTSLRDEDESGNTRFNISAIDFDW